MKNIVLSIFILFFLSNSAFAQKYFTRTGLINFYSKTPLEDIDANSNQASAVVDLEKGEVAWAVLMKSFLFKKALMQEHFNENYVESTKYPKATYKAKILNYSADLLKKDGLHEVVVDGTMTLHGVTKPFKTKGTIEVKGGELLLKSAFKLIPEDYNIKIPQLVRDKIAKEINVKVEAVCQPLNN